MNSKTSEPMILYATGAHGRRATIADWVAGKEFIGQPFIGQPWIGRPLFSRHDSAALRNMGYAEVRFREPDSILGFRVLLAEVK